MANLDRLHGLPRSFDEIRVDRPAPAHVPKDRLVDMTFALGTVPNDCVDPYEPFTWLAGSDVPPIFYHVSDPESYVGKVEGVGGVDRGCWIVTRYEDVDRINTDAEHFTSKHQAEFQQLIGEDFPNIPIGIDPPDHRRYRLFLLPYFSPSHLNKMEGNIRVLAGNMIDEFAHKGEVDVAHDFGRIFPVRIFLNMMGLPTDMLDQFLIWGRDLIHGGSIEKTVGAMRQILIYLRDAIRKAEGGHGEGLISVIANGRIDGQPLTDNEKIGMVWFLWIAGLDTVAASISQMFRRMALQPAIQDQLREHPELYISAVEEFLRTQPILSIARRVKKDFEWHGVQIKRGESVMGMNVTANFEPGRFENPREFNPARTANRHMTFISGIHLCLGAPLARRELRILLEEWFKRIPSFRVKPGADTAVFPAPKSLRNLPLVWDTNE